MKDGKTHIILISKEWPVWTIQDLAFWKNLENQLRVKNKRARLVDLQGNVERPILLARLEARLSIYQKEKEALTAKTPGPCRQPHIKQNSQTLFLQNTLLNNRGRKSFLHNALGYSFNDLQAISQLTNHSPTDSASF